MVSALKVLAMLLRAFIPAPLPHPSCPALQFGVKNLPNFAGCSHFLNGCSSVTNVDISRRTALSDLSDVHEQIQKPGWTIDTYHSTKANRTFTHYVVHYKCDRILSDTRNVWIRFHGSGTGQVDTSYAEIYLNQSLDWIVTGGRRDFVYAFVTTESTMYEGSYHSLCIDEAAGVNVDYELGDWGYALVGCQALEHHLSHLTRYGYKRGISRLTLVGYSDGGWLSSMCAFRGLADTAVAWAGWSFAEFFKWRNFLQRDAVRGMRLDLYVSAGDLFYNGTSGWYPPPNQPGSMRYGLDQLVDFFQLEAGPIETVYVAGVSFERTVFANSADNNTISFHLDTNVSHPHKWMHTSANDLLRATARIS